MTQTSDSGQIARVNGIELYYELSGTGSPLVLLHGFTGSSADWIHVFDLAELARTHRVLLVDLRGHGRSTNPEGALTHRQCALDVAALLDELGIDEVRAIGLSLGANTLLHLATRQPARVEAMVLVAPASYYLAPAPELMRRTTITAPSPEDWNSMRDRHHRGDEQIQALFRQAAVFADTYDDMNFTPPLLSTIRAKTLVVNGDRDPLLPVEQLVEIYRAIPRAALWIVPDGGHGPIFGEWREAFAQSSVSFLENS